MPKLSVINKLSKKPYVPSSDSPQEELRRLVLQHKAITRAAVALNNMSVDKTNRSTGEVIKCRLPEDVMVDLQETAKRQRDRAARLERVMLVELRKVPIYRHFLSRVYGMGPIVSAYLISDIDIRRCEKSSGLRRFCGLGITNGRLDRHTRGGGSSCYNAELRTRLYQAFASMRKNGAKTCASAPLGKTSKYLQVWDNYKCRMSLSERVVDGKIRRIVNGEVSTGSGDIVSAKGFINSTGWHKACDLFLEDLYLVWRAIDGLPVWPTFAEAKTGYGHGGVPVLNQPRLYSLAEALEKVGDVGGAPRVDASLAEVEAAE